MRRPAAGGRRSSLAVLVVSASVLLTACAGIPSSGPVHDAGQVTGVGDDPFTRIFPAPPADGAKPKDIVAGFLTASASFDDNHAVAREFLTQDAARSWNAGAGAQVYQADTTQSGAGVSPLQEVGDGHTVLFQAPLAGLLSPQGAYTGAAAGKLVDEQFQLRQVAGQWRIATLPQGLLLTSNDLSRAYQPYDIYFPNPTRTVVVPDQILVPRGPGASTSLVHALLAGPTAWLSSAVRTAIPAGTKLVVDSVPVRDGVVQVDLTAPAASISRTEAQAMSAQFVWTLRQLGGVTALRLTVDGVPLRVAGVGDAQSIYAWSSFDPDGGTADAQAYAVSKGRAVLMRGNALQAVRGPLGDGSTPVSAVVPSFDGTELAALDEDGKRLVVAAVTPDAKARVLFPGTELTAPTWDRLGDVWVVDRAGTETAVWEASPSSGEKKKVGVDGLPAGTIRAMRLARDGVRVAVLVDDSRGVGQVYLGLVERAASGVTLSSFRLVTTSLATSVDVAWASADRLVVLGRAKQVDPVEAWLVDLNGTVEQGYGTPAQSVLVAVTEAPTHPPLAGSTDGKLWVYSGLGWSQWGGTGTSPAYPG